jgi:iron-sulfur cluster repair protein YtfE (RIC family)
MSDPVAHFEHSHSALGKLTLEVRNSMRAWFRTGCRDAAARRHLLTELERLREDLIHHFAREEEGLFPFVRENVTSSAQAVDRLQDAHDSICGALVRLTHLVEHTDEADLDASRPAIEALYERFERVYAMHSQEEAVLFDGLGRTLDQAQRNGLAEILQGL